VPTAASGSGGPVQVQMPSAAGGFPLTGHCATGNCGTGGCNTCGPRGGLRSHHGGYPGPGGGLALHGGGGTNLGGHPRLGAGGNVCGPTCNPYHYVAFDALYMDNDEVTGFVGTGPFTVDDYDFELGMRVTVGTTSDCRNGYEATFIGPFRWKSESSALPGDVPVLTTFLTEDIVLFPGNNLTSFQNSTSQSQRFEAEFNSFELNRTLIGWEVIKLLYGVRYIQYDEEYLYGANSAAGAGLLSSETENRLFGGQIGIDMTFPVTCRLWSDFRARAGAYANFAENEFRFANAGNLLVSTGDDDTELAGMFEMSAGARYYVTNNLHLRAGGELWYLTQIASAVDQFGGHITSGTGRNIDVGDGVFMYGVSVGAEWKF